MSNQKLEISGQFRRKYGQMVNPDLMSLRMCSNGQKCWLEYQLATDPTKIHELVLDFISKDLDPDDLFFDPKDDIIENAQRFLDFDDYSLVNCTENLLTEEAARKMWEEHYTNL